MMTPVRSKEIRRDGRDWHTLHRDIDHETLRERRYGPRADSQRQIRVNETQLQARSRDFVGREAFPAA